MSMLLNSFIFGSAGEDDGGGGADIEFLGSLTGTFGGARGVSIALSSLLDESSGAPTIIEGDVLVFINHTSNPAPPAVGLLTSPGWKTIHYEVNDDVVIAIHAYTVRADSITTFTMPAGIVSASYENVYQMYAFRGVDGDDPFGAATIASSAGTASLTPDPPSITPTVTGAWPLVAVIGGGDSVITGNFTQPADLSAEPNHFQSTLGLDTVDTVGGTGFKTDWAFGPFNPAVWTGSSSSGDVDWIAVTLALKPAPAPWIPPAETAVEFVGSHVVGFDVSGNVTVNFSSLLDESGGTPTVLAGDLVVVSLTNGTSSAVAEATMTPSGYTSAGHVSLSNGSHQVAYKIMGGTPDSSVVVSGLGVGSSVGKCCAVYVFRGVDTSDPIGAVVTAPATSLGTYLIDEMAIETDNPMIYVSTSAGGSSTGSTSLAPQPAAVLARANHWRSVIQNETTDATLSAGIIIDHQTGNYPAGVMPQLSGIGVKSCIAVEIRPAP